MKGIIYLSLLDMMEEEWGWEQTEKIIMEANLPSEGAYTSAGNYKDEEIGTLLQILHSHTQTPIDTLQKDFGYYLFFKLVQKHPYLLKDYKNSFQLFLTIGDFIHWEVAKLHDNVKTPTITCSEIDENSLILTYQSERFMYALAEGLIKGCLAYFNETHFHVKLTHLDEAQKSAEFMIFKSTKN